MADKKLRGTTEAQELNEEHMTRDLRPPLVKVIASLRLRQTVTVVLACLAVLVVVVPFLSTPALVVAALITANGMRQVDVCPIKMPIQANLESKKGSPDPHEHNVANKNKPFNAKGIFYLGFDRMNGKEVWLTNDDCRQHFLVLGTTGSGKTELLVGFCANALTWASGFLLVDGKGDVSVFAKIYALARRFGREDDLLVLNFMTGESPGLQGDGKILSNTMNPFSTGSSDSLTQMVVSLMEDSGGDGAMWKGRATAMFTGVMRALTFLRDEGVIDLNVSAIRDHLNLRRIIDLADEKLYPHISPAIRKIILSYLTSLPGYQPEKGHKQAQTTLDQHGYLEMQFTKIMGSLADVYGHIFSTPYGEVDMFDVVINRRILIVMLPALEKSADEVANLGKIVVASLKRMMGFTLGNKIEGSHFEIVVKRMTSSPSPFVTVMDEVGYYCVDGMDLMAAQARSLGFSMTYAAQDINGMKRLNDKIVGSIIGNTNTKVIMRIEDPETAKMAIELAGKAYKPTVGGYTGHVGELATSFQDGLEARNEEVERVKFLDLKSQENGQMHVLYKDLIVRGQGLYANPESTLKKSNLKLRANHFIKVVKPDRDELEQTTKIPEILDLLLNPGFAKEMVQEDREARDRMNSTNRPTDEIALVAQGFAGYVQAKPVEGHAVAACAALANVVLVSKDQADVLARRLTPIEDFEGVEEEDELETVGGFPGTAPPPQAGVHAGIFDDDEDFAQPHDAQSGAERDDELFRNMAQSQSPRDDGRPTSLADLARGPRRPARTQNVAHQLDVAGRPVDEEVVSNNDTVFRLLADLDYDPEKVTPEIVAARVEQSTGPADSFGDNAADAALIDAVAFEADEAMPPSVEDAEPEAPPTTEPPQPGDFISTFLSDLLLEEDDK